ncbi:mediator of DNA damage checkpoint 1, transcript variant X1 [Ictidomys tridecemlineatus]|uniref:Mediator of DNA damage checkpoint protein 1 n=2 Tax=Ictidomys tridecemlineatus TaxID=43179 RepID=I3MWX2_ICTTR|nr:mediator of DNA damage checkpoint protein 1 isoform X1 [Ictidomys tridecemlineatus]XP_040138222.1 mediator of DNA damage checkpoint protein 1 isoform X1 [Ictidomys tridecemlineatus]XP_040138223.1 mediator of DNA damage checkpoint protein 1 isoform X1 [Ictidomys tridecemlineatus]KAG3289010.1 mediator of DNA damage checkpoint 1, transcript variant X1 [Ictidomys tridecemlineatus]
MEDTQAVDWDVEEEEETEQSNESSGYILEPIGRLHIFSGAHGPEKDFPLFLGKNVIGRLPDCSVTLPFPSISKQHAVIEISAWNKAPVLQDCGSLNGTQILRPPKVLSPGLSHRLRDQELILFADLPCQYHRLDVRPPYVSRGPLTVEATPKVQEEPQPSRLPLAEDSEEEEDFSKGCVVKESRTTSSSLATVVPESDEEGPSLAPGDSFAFNLDSDTDEEEGQQPAAREASSAARKCAAAEAEQPEASGITTDMWLGKVQPPGEIDKDTKVKRDTGNRVVPVGLILERSQLPEDSSDTDVDEENRPPGKTAEAHLERVQPSGFLDSDTDVEEEGIPATPAVVPMKKRQVFHGVGTRSPATLGSAHLQESPAGSDTDMEEGEAPLAIPLERSQTSMVIDSDTDDEEEVSAALTLARLKESGAVLWNRNADIEKDRVQPVLLQKKSLTTSERDSDTDMEEGLPVEKRETVLNGHTDKEETLVIANSENGQTPLRDNDVGEEADMSSPGVLLERSQAASTTGNINIEVKQEVPSGPAVICWGKHQVLVKGTNQTDKEAKQESAKLPIMPLEAVQSSDEDGETDMEVGMSSEVADVRKSQLLGEGDAETERATAVLESEGTPKVGAYGGSQVQQMVVHTGASGEPLQPQTEGYPLTGKEKKPHMSEAKDSKDSHDDSEDLDLQATQCFVERESQNLDGALDEPWEVLATQPFCPRESEATEPQLIATHLEANGSCLSPPRATPQDQHPESPVHTEPLGIQGREIQTVEKDMGTRKETERVTPEKGPLEREIREGPPEGERKDVMEEEEKTRGIQDREQKQALAEDTQESGKKAKSKSPERYRENSKVEMEISEETEETEIEKQTLTREVFEKVVEKPVPERMCKAAELEVNLERGETEGGNQDQKGQATSPTPEPGVRAEELQGLASAPVVSGNQSGGGRGAPVSPTRQQRGHLNYKMLPAETTSMGDPESPDACLPATMPEALALPLNSFSSQSQKHPELQSLLSPLSSSELPIPRTRYKRSQETPEPPQSSELEPFPQKPSVRPRRSSRMTPSPLSSAALELSSIAPTAQPAAPKSTSRATKGRTHKSSDKTPELQPFSPTEQPITPTPTSRVPRVKTNRSSVKIPESIVHTAPELQPSTSTDQPDTPKLTSRVTRGRTLRSSVNTPEPVLPIAPELQSFASTDQPVIPKPTSRVTRGRTCRSSVKTPEPVFSVTPELQTSTPTEQLLTSKPTFVDSQGRTHRSSVNTPEPILPTDSELQPSTSSDQPVTPQPPSRVTRGRTHRTSVKTPEPILLTGPKVQPSTSTDHQPVAPQLTSRVTRGRTLRSSVKTPETIVPTAPELQPSTSAEQPVTPKSTSWPTRGRTHRSSVKTPEVVVTTAPELQPSTSINHPITHKPTSRISRGRIHKSVETPEPVEPSASDLELPNSTDQPVASKAVCQSGALESLTLSAATLPVTPEFHPSVTTDQPVPFEPTQTSCTRRQRAAGKHGSLTALIVHKPSSAPPEPKCRSSRNQRPRAQRAAECLGTIPEPSFPQLPEAPIHASQIQKVEAAGTSGFIPEPPPKASRSRKRPSTTIDSPPLQKRPQRGDVSQETMFPKEEEEDPEEMPVKEEDIVIPDKRRRDQTEEEPKGIPSRSLRRTKSNQESAAPKVLFTGVVDARGERTVLALGGSLASSVAEASHLVTDRIRRTVKFLCALGKGIPILSLDWLHQSRKAGCFLPPDQYVVSDPEQEKNFGFNLRDALHRSRERRLLEGYEIHVTPGVQPPPSQMGEIISCCGGIVLSSMPRTYKPQRVVITCPQDFPRCSIPSRVGLPLLSPEFLLTGVLKQEAKPEAFVLSTLEMRST